MITLVNSVFGLTVVVGLWLIGVPYAVLWGCLAAMMRFIPYVGAAVAFLLPLVFSVAYFPRLAAAASGTSDVLTLRMLGQIPAPSSCTLVNIEGAGSPMQLAERVAQSSPAMVILSHLPPEALAQARYQVRRLRSRFSGLAIVVGRWGESASDAASQGLSGVGATHVAYTLADARDQILARAALQVPVPTSTVMAAMPRG